MLIVAAEKLDANATVAGARFGWMGFSARQGFGRVLKQAIGRKLTGNVGPWRAFGKRRDRFHR